MFDSQRGSVDKSRQEPISLGIDLGIRSVDQFEKNPEKARPNFERPKLGLPVAAYGRRR